MKYELALIDARILPEVRERLEDFAHHLMPFKTEDITYNSISCHPDVFMHQRGKQITVAPNLPRSYKMLLQSLDLQLLEGSVSVDSSLRNSTAYNCISGPDYILHKKGYTAPEIAQDFQERQLIELPQAYTRCSMLVLKKGVAITSDRGIEKALLQLNWNVFYFSPEEIRIPDHKYGFLGGCCGSYGNRVFTLGNALKHEDGAALEQFVEKHGMELYSLSDEKLYDGGGVFLF